MSFSAKHGERFTVESHAYGPPPPDNSSMAGSRSRWHPRNWTRRTIIGVIVLAVVILIAIIVGAVVGSKSNSYPDYSPLSYTLQDTYAGENFFDDFVYFNDYDPAGGFVHYVPQETANLTQYNLTYASPESAVLRVDTSETNADTGRFSVRITSKKQYNSGLFVFDVLNTPYGCSTWPALWLSDPANWPENGEIDIVEQVNQATSGVQSTLHTAKGCKMDVKRKQTGQVLANNCWNEADDNAGCGVSGKPDSYGKALNQNGGGIYAMEYRNEGIRVWFFPRADIPADIPDDVSNTTAPDPSSWPEPLADFPNTDCDVGKYFANQSIIANIDLCGDWAGSKGVYTKQDECPGSCTDFVATNNTAFETAYWEWRSWRVYQAN